MINKNEYKDIYPSFNRQRGENLIVKPYFILDTNGYFRCNRRFLSIYKLENSRFVFVKTKYNKKNNKMDILFKFTKEEITDNNAYRLSHSNPFTYTFCGRGVFLNNGIDYRNIIKDRQLNLVPKICKINKEKYIHMTIQTKGVKINSKVKHI